MKIVALYCRWDSCGKAIPSLPAEQNTATPIVHHMKGMSFFVHEMFCGLAFVLVRVP